MQKWEGFEFHVILGVAKLALFGSSLGCIEQHPEGKRRVCGLSYGLSRGCRKIFGVLGVISILSNS